MSDPGQRIDADETVSEAARRLYEDRIGSLIVEDDGVLGIVTETDIVGAVAREDPGAIPVREVVSESLATVDWSAWIEEADELMDRYDTKRLLVTEDGAVVEIVTTTDISNYFPSYHPREESVG